MEGKTPYKLIPETSTSHILKKHFLPIFFLCMIQLGFVNLTHIDDLII